MPSAARGSLAISRRGYVLERGRIVAAGTAAELTADPALAASFLGASPPVH